MIPILLLIICILYLDQYLNINNINYIFTCLIDPNMYIYSE
jgi:hypothetical protein